MANTPPEQGTDNVSQLTKVTVNLVPRAVAAVAEAKQLSPATTTDIINRAVQLYAYVMRQNDAGKGLAVIDGDRTILTEVQVF